MKTVLLLSLLLAAALFGPVGAMASAALDQTLVYVICTTPEEKTSRGTGVVVSDKGHVLTAAHVAPQGAECRGSIGVADDGAARKMVFHPTTTNVDARLLRFSAAGDYAFVPYCPLEDWMVRRRIFVAGFPGRTETGAASYREGVLSTVLPDSRGLLETDGQTIAGMSGGPVFSKNLAGLIGIVIGAEFDASGAVSYYGVLSAEFFADTFNLAESEVPCYRQSREVELPAAVATWRAGDDPMPLGIRSDEGVCYLAGVAGLFNDPADRIEVELRDGEYFLVGDNRSGGNLGGQVRCVWYE
jgi:hypothetical protein